MKIAKAVVTSADYSYPGYNPTIRSRLPSKTPATALTRWRRACSNARTIGGSSTPSTESPSMVTRSLKDTLLQFLVAELELTNASPAANSNRRMADFRPRVQLFGLEPCGETARAQAGGSDTNTRAGCDRRQQTQGTGQEDWLRIRPSS